MTEFIAAPYAATTGQTHTGVRRDLLTAISAEHNPPFHLLKDALRVSRRAQGSLQYFRLEYLDLLQGAVAPAGLDLSDLVDDVHPFNDRAKYRMLAVEIIVVL